MQMEFYNYTNNILLKFKMINISYIKLTLCFTVKYWNNEFILL